MATAAVLQAHPEEINDHESHLSSLKLDLQSSLPRREAALSIVSTSCGSSIGGSICASPKAAYTVPRDDVDGIPLSRQASVSQPGTPLPEQTPNAFQAGTGGFNDLVAEEPRLFKLPHFDRHGRVLEAGPNIVRRSYLETVLPPAPPLCRPDPKDDTDIPPENVGRSGLFGILSAFAEWLCKPKDAVQPPAPSPVIWYKVMPSSTEAFSTTFYARMVGPQEALEPWQQRRLLCAQGAGDDLPEPPKMGSRRRSDSRPATLDKGWDIDRGFGYSKNDLAEEDLCSICYANPAEVVMLPCKHGRICDTCFRRSVFMRPVHRGGQTCPYCRKFIQKAIILEKVEVKKHPLQWRYGVLDEL